MDIDARREAEVLVVGAGPVGLTAALALTRLGVSVRIVDAASGPSREPRAAVIWPREAEVLALLGLGPALRAAARPLAASPVFVRGRLVATLGFGRVDSAFPEPLVIEQHETQRLLTEALAELGVAVERGTALAGLEAGEREVRARLTTPDGETVEAAFPWLVAADGARSGVRKALGIGFPGRAVRDLEVVQVNATPTRRGERIDLSGLHLTRGRALGAFPTPNGATRFYAFQTIAKPGRTTPPTLAEMRDLVAGSTRLDGLELTGATWLNRARFQERTAARMRRGRVLLVGDAAHVWPAVGGRGMNVGLLGAVNLAWKLAAVARGEASGALLDSYETEQRAMVRRAIRMTRWDLLERPLSHCALAGVAALLPAALACRPVARAVERTLSDLDLTHTGALTRGAGAGGRHPDQGALALDRWTLFAPPDADPEPLARLAHTRRAAVVLRPGRSPSLQLVRPDGWTGFSGRADRVEALEGYMAEHLAAG